MIIPKILETSYPYKGKIVTIRKDKLTRDGEKTFVRETAAVADSVAIVAVDDRNRVLLIRQYRHPVGEPVWEIPAGRMDIEDEKPEQTALRELQEETDTSAEKIQYLTVFGNSVGWTTEKTYVFLARGLKGVLEYDRQNEEADIEKKWISMSKALDMVRSGQLNDAKTIIGLLLAGEYIVRK